MLPRTRITRWLATFVFAVGVINANNAAAADDASLSVEVALAVGSGVSELSRRVFVEEVDAIWRDAGVHIRWIDGDIKALRVGALRVLLVQRPAIERRGSHWVVGELLRAHNGVAVALISISRAREIVNSARSSTGGLTPDSLLHHRVGVVLGRAIAHEIGHYLLESGAHTSRGLMRATLHPREFIDLRPGGFTLDEASQRRLFDRLRRPAASRRAVPADDAHVIR